MLTHRSVYVHVLMAYLMTFQLLRSVSFDGWLVNTVLQITWKEVGVGKFKVGLLTLYTFARVNMIMIHRVP
jgi:hypothetical protein